MINKLMILIALMFFIGSCAGNPSLITKEYDTEGRLIKETIGTTNNQVEYYKTQRHRDIQISKEPPAFSLDWIVLKTSGLETVYLPKVTVYNDRDRAEIVKTPTTGQIVAKGAVDVISATALPLAIGGMAATAIQGLRSSEEHKPNMTIGGDNTQVEKAGTAITDKSSKPTKIIEESFNTEHSHNTKASSILSD